MDAKIIFLKYIQMRLDYILLDDCESNGDWDSYDNEIYKDLDDFKDEIKEVIAEIDNYLKFMEEK